MQKYAKFFLEDREKAPGILECVAGSGFAESIVGIAKYKIGEGFTGSIAKYWEGFIINSRDELKNLKIGGQKVWEGKHDNIQWPSTKSKFRNLIALPLKIKNNIIICN